MNANDVIETDNWIVVNKKKQEKLYVDDNKKYKICRHVIDRSECKFKERCNFAHEIKELNSSAYCKYGNNCKKIKYNYGKCINNGINICIFIHPKETLAEYINRNK